jgi:hypothetical protein
MLSPVCLKSICWNPAVRVVGQVEIQMICESPGTLTQRCTYFRARLSKVNLAVPGIVNEAFHSAGFHQLLRCFEYNIHRCVAVSLVEPSTFVMRLMLYAIVARPISTLAPDNPRISKRGYPKIRRVD